MAFVGMHVGAGYAGEDAYYFYINGKTIGAEHNYGGCAISMFTVPMGKGDVLSSNRNGYIWIGSFVPYK